MHTKKHSVASGVALAILAIIWILLGLLVFTRRQEVIDWLKLRGYTPTASIVAITNADDFTDLGDHLFYVNKPEIISGADFSSNCPAGSEKTVVLGCYVGGDNGIFLYKVTDVRLNGVIEATAAHEMLHAGYDRLSEAEKTRVNALLQDYYDNDLKDARIRKVIESYRESEPTEILNEMHSVFGTELPNLPTELETYYSKYFDDRSAVVNTVARYENEFTKRTNQIDAYDTELQSMKQQIDTNTALLEAQRSQLNAQSRDLNASRNSIPASEYNVKVAAYNQAVDSYNTLLAQTKSLIERHNQIVEKRNAVAIEQQELVQALSPQNLPSAK